jgi:hypothetical protein
MTRPDLNGRPASETEEQLLRGGSSWPIAPNVTEGHSQCSPKAGAEIAVLLPEELPVLTPRPPERFSDCCTMWQSRTVAVREDRRGPPNTGVGAVVDQASEWAAFDALLGIEVESAPDATVGAYRPQSPRTGPSNPLPNHRSIDPLTVPGECAGCSRMVG